MKSLLFKPDLAALIAKGTKTQTRRIKPALKVGDIFYVKEPWRVANWGENFTNAVFEYGDRSEVKTAIALNTKTENQCIEDAEAALSRGAIDFDRAWGPNQSPCRWRNSMFMPEWAARSKCRVTRAWTEPLSSISHVDAVAEGCASVSAYQALWEIINGAGTWGSQTVFCYEFERC